MEEGLGVCEDRNVEAPKRMKQVQGMSEEEGVSTQVKRSGLRRPQSTPGEGWLSLHPCQNLSWAGEWGGPKGAGFTGAGIRGSQLQGWRIV